MEILFYGAVDAYRIVAHASYGGAFCRIWGAGEACAFLHLGKRRKASREVGLAPRAGFVNGNGMQESGLFENAVTLGAGLVDGRYESALLQRCLTSQQWEGGLGDGQVTTQVTRSEEERAFRALLNRRRKRIGEVLTEVLLASKLSEGYSKLIISSMPEFIDRVLIKAAALKRKPELVNKSFSFRARFYIDEIGVAKIIKWLKHNHLTVPQIGKLIFLVEDYVECLQPKIEWLKSIYVRGRDLGVVLTREPCILEKDIDELNEVVEFLESNGLKRDWIGLVLRRCPRVLSLGMEELQQRVAFFAEIGIAGASFGTMVFKFPPVLGRFSLDEMYSKVNFLKGFALDSHSLGQVIARKPYLLACSIEDDWKPLITCLYYLGVDRSAFGRIIAVDPSVFCLSIDDNIVPKIQFFRTIGVHDEAIGSMIVKFPALLTYSLDKKIRPMVRFLLERAGVSENDVGKVFAAQPELLRCSMPNKLEMLVKYLLSQGIQREDIGKMVGDFPVLLKYSLPVLRPKLKYFKKTMNRPLNEVVNFPRFFSYSLESRISSRHKMLQEKGINFNLKCMLACSDAEFHSKVENAYINCAAHNVLEPAVDGQKRCQEDHVSFIIKN